MNNKLIMTTRILYRKLFPLLLATSYSLLLTGCGFHLKGSANLPASMAKTYIQGQVSRGLSQNIRSSLRVSGITVVDSIDEASAILNIHRETEDRRVLSVNSLAKVSEYELSYSLTFSVIRKDGVQVVPVQTTRLTRDYNFDENVVLSKADEESILRKEMKRDAVSDMMRRLEALGR